MSYQALSNSRLATEYLYTLEDAVCGSESHYLEVFHTAILPMQEEFEHRGLPIPEWQP